MTHHHPPRHHHRSMALREAARWGIARVKKVQTSTMFGSEPIVSHPTLSSPPLHVVQQPQSCQDSLSSTMTGRSHMHRPAPRPTGPSQMVCTASEWLTAKGERDARLLQHLDASSGSGAKS